MMKTLKMSSHQGAPIKKKILRKRATRKEKAQRNQRKVQDKTPKN
jgi:hypothetical protein